MENKCNGLHCRCMNLDKQCPNAHYADCTTHNPALSHTPTVDSSVDWEKEFDEKFYSKYQLNDVLIPKYEMTNAFLEELKDFIRTNRQSLITRIKGEIEKMKKETCDCLNTIGYHTKECDFEPFGYNHALNDVLRRMNNLD